MATKAGRVGVNPSDVDPVSGHISPESVDSYTKEQSDAKYETKEDAATLQPINLSVPIEMLDGTKLTVESALKGLNDVSKDIVDEGVLLRGTYPSGANYDGDVDDLTSGIVYCGNQAAHRPIDWCIILTFVAGNTPSATFMCQMALNVTNVANRMFYRAKVNNVWSEWSEVQMKTS